MNEKLGGFLLYRLTEGEIKLAAKAARFEEILLRASNSGFVFHHTPQSGVLAVYYDNNTLDELLKWIGLSTQAFIKELFNLSSLSSDISSCEEIPESFAANYFDTDIKHSSFVWYLSAEGKLYGAQLYLT